MHLFPTVRLVPSSFPLSSSPLKGIVRTDLWGKKENVYFCSAGKYRVKLFNRPTNKWVYLNVDDHIPVDSGTGQCVFAKPNGDEAW